MMEATFAKNLEAIDSALFRDLLTNEPEDRLGALDADKTIAPRATRSSSSSETMELIQPSRTTAAKARFSRVAFACLCS